MYASFMRPYKHPPVTEIVLERLLYALSDPVRLEIVRRLAELFQNLGLLQVAYRSDQEAALTAMFDAACRLSGRKSLPATAE